MCEIDLGMELSGDVFVFGELGAVVGGDGEDVTLERAEHLHKLEWLLLQKLTENKLDFRYNGGKNHLPGLLSLSFKGADGEALLHRLDLMGISVSTGSACNSKSTELSHVLNAIDIPDEYAFGTIRVSLGYENTEEDVVEIAKAIEKTLN